MYLGTAPVWYLDADGDTFGSPSAAGMSACAAGPGMVSNNDDCDDSSFGVNPGATETCNSVDDDCDGESDPPGSAGSTAWYLDADEDGYGNSALMIMDCTAPTGFSANDGDCDDINPLRYPGAQEVCDGLDSDCTGGLSWPELDDDGDGFIPCSPIEPIHNFQIEGGGDCDDGPLSAQPGSTQDGAEIYPGANDNCDGLDNDCDGVIDEFGCIN